jgi:hypothetical protein
MNVKRQKVKNKRQKQNGRRETSEVRRLFGSVTRGAAHRWILAFVRKKNDSLCLGDLVAIHVLLFDI